MRDLEHAIHELSPHGLQINIWPSGNGKFQANVNDKSAGDREDGWTCATRDNPIDALEQALMWRCGYHLDHPTAGPLDDDGFEELIG